jgi:hypothetical protein
MKDVDLAEGASSSVTLLFLSLSYGKVAVILSCGGDTALPRVADGPSLVVFIGAR